MLIDIVTNSPHISEHVHSAKKKVRFKRKPRYMLTHIMNHDTRD